VDRPHEKTDRQLAFLRDLLAENAYINGDVLHLGQELWGVHGVIPVDGDVLMAEFETYDDARRTLDEVSRDPLSPPDL
jgi:hypothetical protein